VFYAYRKLIFRGFSELQSILAFRAMQFLPLEKGLQLKKQEPALGPGRATTPHKIANRGTQSGILTYFPISPRLPGVKPLQNCLYTLLQLVPV
jgi:hypothetical protein